MTTFRKISLLRKAAHEFELLGKKSIYKARVYQVLDIFIKLALSVCGAMITYFSENSKNDFMVPIRIMGILIASLTAISSVFMFEKRSHCNIQVYSKCQAIIPEIEDKIDSLRNGENLEENIHEYIQKIFKDLSTLSLSSFTDAVFEKLSSRNLNN